VVTEDKCWAGTRLTIFGHTDVGEREAISGARAKAARDYLIAKGVAARRIRIESHGSRYPRKPSRDGKPSHENQRAEIAYGLP
jgi:outer membrane protein OmpA-like peptidoglycan-associated protein